MTVSGFTIGHHITFFFFLNDGDLRLNDSKRLMSHDPTSFPVKTEKETLALILAVFLDTRMITLSSTI